MKRSVNFNGFQAKHRRITAEGLLAALRALGLSDEEIKAELLKWQAEQMALSTPQGVGAAPELDRPSA